MKKIKLTKGKWASVDDDMFDYLNQWKWCYSKGYAVRRVNNKLVLMHRIINKTPDNFITDHIDRNTLNNQKTNLRTVNKSQNGINRPKQKNNKSGYKGIMWDKFRDKWRADIRINNKNIFIGRFLTIDEALIARKKAEGIYHAI